MLRLRAIFMLVLCSLGLPWAVHAQKMDLDIEPLTGEGEVEYDMQTGLFTASKGVVVRYGGAVLTADRVKVNQESGEVVADGQVRIERDDQVWASEHLRFNFKTQEIDAERFRTGKAPVYAGGEGLHGERTNQIYAATNTFVTTEDYSNPLMKVRAKHIKLTPGEKIEARHATLYVGGVPMFYFPYYSRKLEPEANNFNFLPGYRSSYGGFLLGRYQWYLSEELDAVIHADYRQKQGFGGGPDLNYHLGQWGEGTARYYVMQDKDWNKSDTGALPPGELQRVYFTYLSNPFTNLYARSMVRWQTGTNMIKDFFEAEYRQDPQPNTYVEVNRFWQNFSLDTYVEPRINDFLNTVERLPEVRLTGYRQQVLGSPIYYETVSSAGYYEQLFAVSNSIPTGLDYAAARADTFHQLTLPYTAFGWLNVTPRAGGRLTYYSQATGPGATTDDLYRGVFNTGAEVSVQASRLWPGVENNALEVDGLRHIVRPSVNYAYVPQPNYPTNDLPQFDYQVPSLRQLPIDFPDYNRIDSIQSENTFRLGLNNKLQTKRQEKVVNLVNWDLYTDWLLQPVANQTTFSDLYSDLVLRPRSWLTVESLTRHSIANGQFDMSYNALTVQPNTAWSWSIGYFYLRTNTISPGDPGNNLLTSTMFFRFNENWGFRSYHRYEVATGLMEEQAYSIYRDMRSWTAALTFRVLDNPTGPKDYTVAFTFSLKAFPRFGLGQDVAKPYALLGEY